MEAERPSWSEEDKRRSALAVSHGERRRTYSSAEMQKMRPEPATQSESKLETPIVPASEWSLGKTEVQSSSTQEWNTAASETNKWDSGGSTDPRKFGESGIWEEGKRGSTSLGTQIWNPTSTEQSPGTWQEGRGGSTSLGAEDCRPTPAENVAFGSALPDTAASHEASCDDLDPELPFVSKSKFDDFHLSPDLMRGIYKLNFKTPSKIQADALRLVIPQDGNRECKNLIAQGHTGSGKTASFVLAMLNRVDESIEATQALCIVPTRELARQVQAVVAQLGAFTRVTSRLLIPMSDGELQEARRAGKSLYPRRGEAKEHIAIGTPGKVGDWLKRRLLDPSYVKLFVVDEADKMVDAQSMGDQTLRIKKLLPLSTQVLLFSATYADNVQELATKVAPDANMITCEREKLSLGRVQQYFLDAKTSSGRFGVIEDVYDTLQLGQTVIFVETRRDCRELTARLRDGGHTVSLLTGGEMSTDERDEVIDEFRAGTTRVLITTNVLSRGIDIPSVNAVINYDMPRIHDGIGEKVDAETYLHRVGRSGRFGRKGIAISLVYDDKSRRMVDDLSSSWKRNIKPVQDVEELEDMINGLAKEENS